MHIFHARLVILAPVQINILSGPNLTIGIQY